MLKVLGTSIIFKKNLNANQYKVPVLCNGF